MRNLPALLPVPVFLLVPILLLGPVLVGAAPVQARTLPHLVLDLDSGRVITQESAFDPWHPASLTKMMTAWTVFEAIRTGAVAPDAPVRITPAARRAPPSRMGYRTGTTMTVEAALALTVVKSANDVAVALAEAVSGSVPAFARRMNGEAARLGMTGSNFVNPHGLHDARQVVTARDMGLLARAIHRRHPDRAALFAAPAVSAPAARGKDGKRRRKLHFSYNLLLERYRGADGFKTGFVCASGYNFVAAASRGGRRIAAVVLGRDGQKSRAVDAARLLTDAFQKPMGAGVPIAQLRPDRPPLQAPRNMRPILCTEPAWAARYNPTPQTALIVSPWLDARRSTGRTLRVDLEGASAARPLAPGRVPRPVFRPAAASGPTRAPTPDRTPARAPSAPGPAVGTALSERSVAPSAPAAAPAAARAADVALPTFRPSL